MHLLALEMLADLHFNSGSRSNHSYTRIYKVDSSNLQCNARPLTILEKQELMPFSTFWPYAARKMIFSEIILLFFPNSSVSLLSTGINRAVWSSYTIPTFTPFLFCVLNNHFILSYQSAFHKKLDLFFFKKLLGLVKCWLFL